MFFQVQADPHRWPSKSNVDASACALIIVDMQNDYCSPGHYIAKAGYDTDRLRWPIPRIQQVLTVARQQGFTVIYTQHGRTPSKAATDGSANSFPTTALRGEPGWEIVPELQPQANDIVIQKSTINAFFSGELDRLLRSKGIKHLAFCGNTIDVCVHSSLRAAIDLGYDCVLLGDCCGAVNDGLHRWALESVKIEDGVFGSVTNAEDFVNALT